MEPYKGLRPYEEQDQDNFFGREEEKHILADKIRTNKLTLLFAASGVGKSSLLQAAVLPELKPPRRENFDVVYFRDWVDDPCAALQNAIIGYLKEQQKINADYTPDVGLSLKEFLYTHMLFCGDALVIILDQFEEFFNYQRHTRYFAPFVQQLSAAIQDRDTPTLFVISMREDFALELNAFKEHLFGMLFENYYRLEKLSLENAKKAIKTPLEKNGFAYEEGLLDRLLADLSRREQTDRLGLMVDAGAPAHVEPPNLQIVCTQLWEAEKDNPDKRIRIATYEKKGGAVGLLTNYFHAQAAKLSIAEKKLASLAFNYLVNKHGTKMAYPLPDLAQLLRVDEKALGNTLEKLEQARILRKQIRQSNAAEFNAKPQKRLDAKTQRRKGRRKGILKKLCVSLRLCAFASGKSVDKAEISPSVSQSVLWYELYHDVFSKSIYDWNEAYKTRQRIKKLAIFSGSGLLVAASVFAGYDTWLNHTHYHLRLSVKSGISDRIEVYQGEPGSLDIFGQQRYLYETVYQRTDIETDKLFTVQPVYDIDQANIEVIGRFPLADRIDAYWLAGETKTTIDLAQCSISEHNIALSNKMLESLGGFYANQSFEIVLNHLTNVNAEIRKNAVDALMRMETAGTVQSLEILTDHPQAYVRAGVADVLGRSNSNEAITPLTEMLEDHNQDVRQSAAGALVNLGTAEVAKIIAARLEKQTFSEIFSNSYWQYSYDENSRAFLVIKTLRQLDDSQATKLLIGSLKDQDSSVRLFVVSALGYLGSTEAVKPLIGILKDQEPYVRSNVAGALGSLGSAEAVKPLIDILKDQDSDVRWSAAKALVQLGYQPDNPDPPLSASQIKMLKEAKEKFGHPLTPEEENLEMQEIVYKDKEKTFATRITAFRELGKPGRKADAERLMRLVKQDRLSSFAFHAYRMLGDIGDPTALEFLKKRLEQLQADKNQWHKARDADMGIDIPSTGGGCQAQAASSEIDKKRWHYGPWETELAYAIARIEPEPTGIALLSHSLANVRKGAWLGLARKADGALVERLVQKHAENQHAAFRYAVYRAIDHSLLTLEHQGNKQDLKALQTLQPAHPGIKDRLDWTITQLSHSLEQQRPDARTQRIAKVLNF